MPAGAYEVKGILQLCFGKPYELRVEDDLSADEKDERATKIMMEQIACLLPSQLRGEFA